MRARVAVAMSCVLACGGVALTRCALSPDESRADEEVWPVRRAQKPREVWSAALGAAAMAPPDDGGVGPGGECRSIRVLAPDGTPAPDGSVVLEVWAGPVDPDTPPIAHVEAHTAADGVTELCAPLGSATLDAWDGSGRWVRRVTRWRSGDRADVHVMDAPSLRGRVVDEQGAPIMGAHVFVQPYARHRLGQSGPQQDRHETFRMTGIASTQTDRGGRFELRVGALTLFRASVYADEHVPSVTDVLAARPAENVEVQIVMRRGVSLCGTVYGAGAPLARASVGATRANDLHTATDERGRFCLRAAHHDALAEVWAQADGWITEFVEAPANGVRIDLQRAARLRVRARFPDARCGEPRRGSVHVDISWGTSSRVGAASLGAWQGMDVHPGEASVSLSALGHSAAQRVSLRAGETTELDMLLEVPADAAVLSLRLSDPEPARLLRAEITSDDGMHSERAYLDSHGGCVGLEPGRYRVELLGPRQGQGEAVLVPGRVTELVLDAVRAESGERPPRCWPTMETDVAMDTLRVARVHTSQLAVLPGDHIVRVDEHDAPAEMHAALGGPQGSVVRVRVVRPDGSGETHDLARTYCP